MLLDPHIDEKYITRDLTLQASQRSLGKKYGKDRELRLLKEILCRRKRNRVLLIGEHGVGKRVAVEALAEEISRLRVPDLNDFQVLEMNTKAFPARDGTDSLLEFEQFLEAILTIGNIILFIEDIELLYQDDEHGPSLGDIFIRFLDNRQLRVIATTVPSKEKSLLHEHHLHEYFTPLWVREPSETECINIILALKRDLENHYGIQISEDIIGNAVKLSNRHIHDKFQPDKALDLLDSACSRARIDSQASKKEEGAHHPAALALHHLESIIEDTHGIPIVSRKELLRETLRDIEALISREIMCQSEAISAVSRLLQANLSLPELRGVKPLAIFLFLGPTGVGKTELARVLARLIFKGDSTLLRLNMSEYSESHCTAKLIGAPPGYVGFESGSVLSDIIRKSPHSLLLLDEIEKAHRDVTNLFLQVFDEGKLRDSKGEIIDFRHTIIIMTGNIGAELFDTTSHIGFVRHSGEEIFVSKDQLDKKIAEVFPREFINRIDRIVLFKPLRKEKIKGIIIDKYLAEITSLLKERDVTLEIEDNVLDLLSEAGYNALYGVRFLERKFTELIAEPIGVWLCERKFEAGTVRLIAENGFIALR